MKCFHFLDLVLSCFLGFFSRRETSIHPIFFCVCERDEEAIDFRDRDAQGSVFRARNGQVHRLQLARVYQIRNVHSANV